MLKILNNTHINRIIMFKKNIWHQVTTALASSISKSEMNTWLSPTALKKIDKDSAIIEVPNKFVATWLKDNYLEQIKNSFYEQVQYRPQIRFSCKGQNSYAALPNPEPRRKSDNTPNADINQLYTFDGFITDKGNQFAFSLASKMAKSKENAFTLLYIFSEIPSGKTHLLNAIANHVRQKNPDATTLCKPLEKFATAYSFSFKNNTLTQFKDKHRNSEYFLLDDIHRIVGKEKLQREIIYLIDYFNASKKNIAFAGNFPPNQIRQVLPELRSRLEWGVISELKPPNQITRMKIIKQKAKAQKFTIPEDVSFFLASTFPDVKILTQELVRLGAYSSLNRKQINISMAKSFLKNRQGRKVEISDIQKLAAVQFNISLPDLLSNKKTKKYVYPRHIAMYLSRELTGLSLKEIAKAFGNRDHSTVIYGVKRISQDMKQRKEVLDDVNKLQKMLYLNGS